MPRISVACLHSPITLRSSEVLFDDATTLYIPLNTAHKCPRPPSATQPLFVEHSERLMPFVPPTPACLSTSTLYITIRPPVSYALFYLPASHCFLPSVLYLQMLFISFSAANKKMGSGASITISTLAERMYHLLYRAFRAAGVARVFPSQPDLFSSPARHYDLPDGRFSPIGWRIIHRSTTGKPERCAFQVPRLPQ